jgi:replicative DNA helicase
MSETTEYTLTAYKGPEFQQKLMWQLLVEPEYAEKALPNLAVEYFDDPNLKRLFLIILEYLRTYEKVPNLQNQSIHQAINEFKTPHNVIEEESLFAVVKRIELFNERILNKSLAHDGEVVQKSTNDFIKQQEYRKLAEGIIVKTKNGEMKNKKVINEIEEKFQKIANIGNDEDCGSDVVEGLEKALRREFRETIPTGVKVLDDLTGGGLGKGEMGLILTPSGVGKTTLLTKIANTARANNKNVLQIIFEDTKEQIQRKHVTIWTGIPLSCLDENNVLALQKSNHHINNVLGPGRLTIKKFSQEDTTMKDVKNFIIREQKKWGFKFDIVVLDYLDCLESHKRTADRNEAELVIVKAFEALAGDLNIPCWSAIQSNRSGFGAELVDAQQSGGNIKRVQKAHFFMSVAKTDDQKEASLANIKIIKARFAQDGQIFKDCIFNNDTMEIIINGDKYVGIRNNKLKKYGEEELNKLENATNNINKVHVAASLALDAKDEDEFKNALQNDMLKKYLEDHPDEIPKTESNEIIVSGDIGQLPDTLIPIVDLGGHHQTLREDETLYTVKEKTEDNFELEEDKPIEKIDAVSDGANEGVSDGAIPDLLEITGKTENVVTNEIEVNIDVIKQTETPKIEEKTVVHEINEEKNNNFFITEKEFGDPDAPSNTHKSLYDVLTKMAKSQKVKADD